MRTGPLRRLFAAFGLIALVPIALMVTRGDLTVAEAGMRAGIVFGVVLVVVRVSELALSLMAASLERRAVEAKRAGRVDDGEAARIGG
jgi:hypothetical protein